MRSNNRERGQFVSSEVYPEGAAQDLRQRVQHPSEEETQEIESVAIMLAPGLLIVEEEDDENDVPFSLREGEEEVIDIPTIEFEYEDNEES